MALIRPRDHSSLDVTLMGHPEARNVGELWAGKTNIKERRRLQNRLNRRAYRKRQAEQKLVRKRTMAQAGIEPEARMNRMLRVPGVTVFSLDVKHDQTQKGPISLTSLVSAAGMSSGEDAAVLSSSPQRHLRLLQSWCRKFEETMRRAGLISVEPDQGSPTTDSDAIQLEEVLVEVGHVRYPDLIPNPEDQLINLMYYNVFRGLAKNIRALNLDIQSMASWNYDSPFVTGKVDVSTLAPDFQPTYLQRTISHHPCFDVFPDPVVRDNAIVHWYIEKHPLEGRLCMALAGRHTWHEIDLALKCGCILWGEPDVAESWEVTEGFARDWPFLVKGAVRLEAATNRYRAFRGEPPILFA
ncbi:hypothetical protein G647_02117 [Cladophialophora carrionii CBS 160.54]|uniref:BZIP domain-containing protein n=1 Tax=Cladophialophora carrionii CBS 160.54 TaxID=1279043 RepID=V9DEQ9_9EURO|nr:uncharacterized protein G647_02117 [Cladophialophora carrionii CBS 160.54]ETI25345.1 hypothetical protein G647_02117 [Cladophialophora carrionii CBS 160.54]